MEVAWGRWKMGQAHQGKCSRKLDFPAQKRKVTPSGLALATSAGRAVSLISSLVYVRVPASITVHYRALSRVDGPSWSVLNGHP